MAEQATQTTTPSRTDRKNISSIETFFDSLLRGSNKLTNNLFVGEVPPAIDKSWTELAVVNCGNPLSDYDAYGRATVLVYLYSKVNAYGVKDVKTMQTMEKKLNELIEASNDSYYHVSLRGRYSGYDDINDFHMTIVQINLIIS